MPLKMRDTRINCQFFATMQKTIACMRFVSQDRSPRGAIEHPYSCEKDRQGPHVELAAEAISGEGGNHLDDDLGNEADGLPEGHMGRG